MTKQSREVVVSYRIVAILLLSMGMASTASAQILECINASGKREFAQTCPPGTVKQKEMAGSSATKPIDNAVDSSGSSQKSASQMDIEFQQRRIAREQQDEKIERDRKNQQYKCAALKERLNMYENSRSIKKYDQATGKWSMVEDEQRPAIMAQIRNDLRQCN
jgi:hypothetical protein